MNRLALPCTLLACSLAGPAFASGNTGGSSAATDGRIRGAQLEAALRFLREKYSTAQRASDMQLAQAILAL